MAISNIDPVTQQLASSAVKTVENTIANTPLGNEIKQGQEAIAEVENKVSGFSSILSLAQQAANINTDKPESKTAGTEFINAMQQSLFSSLGMEHTDETSLEQKLKSLTSDESIEKLQAAFLLNLQQSLFSPKQATTSEGSEPQNKQQNLPNASKQVAKPGALKALEQLSFGANGFDLSDGFDTVNVLNHVPVVSELYKNISGHDVSAISKLAGGYLYGGPTGLAFSALDLASGSLFDNSISGVLANFDYQGLFSNATDEQAKVDEQVSKVETGVKGEAETGVYWPNRYVPEYRK